MAGTGSAYRGHSTYNRGRPHSDEWNKADYDAEYACRRSVITYPDGKTRTVITCAPLNDPESYVETSETIEHVYSPLTPEYRHGSPKGYRHSSPVHDPPKEVEDLLSKLQIEASRLNRHGHHSAGHHSTPGYEYDHDYKKNGVLHNPNNYDDYYYDKKRTTSPSLSPQRPTHQSTKPNGSLGYDDYYYDKKRTTSPSLSPPRRPTHQSTKPNGSLGYDDYYYDKKRTTSPSLSPSRRPTHESTKPNGSLGYDDYNYDKNNTTEPNHGPWHPTHHSTKPNGTLGYGGYSDYNGDELYKPSANYKRRDGGVDHYCKDGNKEPIRTGGLAKPSHATLTTPHNHNAKLGLSTNDIDEAIGYLKGSKPLSVTATRPTTRFTAVPKQVDQQKAVEGHDKYQSSPRPEPTRKVMTSYEAAKKYNGILVRGLNLKYINQ